ncbi:MAG: type VI secretion system-associated protein TagF [Polyangiaceae bacterium]|nr:type VI secretion system-associated protein TagF [Polyangiaceae bacterium]MCW5789245.1 type VI secretion system-associated protein TagF [Polyangiaceae bacterium]
MIVGYFGKLPSAGDFLRGGVAGEPASGFERWVEQGMVYGGSRRASWAADFDAGAPHGFVYRPPASAQAISVIAGVIAPSRDRVGRRFPIVIFCQIPGPILAGAPHVAPLLLGEFLEHAGEILHAAPTLSPEAFRAAVAGVAAPRIDQLATHATEYAEWAQGTPTSTPFGVTYGDPSSAGPAHAIDTLIQCVAPMLGQEPMDTPLAARLPLGAGGIASAAFWIDVTRRVARWRQTTPTAFWSAAAGGGQLLIQLGATPVSSLAELWSPDPDSDHVCDLVGQPRASTESIHARLPPHVAERLRELQAPITQLLYALSA